MSVKESPSGSSGMPSLNAGDQFPDCFPDGPSAYMKLFREFILVGKSLPRLQMLVPDELEQVIYSLFGLVLVVLIHISTPL